MLTTYQQIYERYLTESKLIAKGNVLKTDAHNEAKIYGVSLPIVPHIENCYCIEYDEYVLNKAKENYPLENITKGDIRKLDFTDKFFDTVIDLSTIDHISPKEVLGVLYEYKRVLKDDGKMLMVVWTGKEVVSEEWKSTDQYYFDRDMFEGYLKDLFKIDYSEELFKHGDNILVLYRLSNEKK